MKTAGILGAILLGACTLGVAQGFRGYERLQPRGSGLPDKDIAFIPVDTSSTIGFINADGTGYETREVEYSEGLFRDIARMGPPGLSYWLTWSPDGTSLISSMGHINRGSGVPMMIRTDGELLICPVDEQAPYGNARAWGVSGTSVLALDEGVGAEPDQVVLFDLQTCTVESTLYESEEQESLREAAISTSGWLAIARGLQGGALEVIVLDVDGNQRAVLPGGDQMSWSRDSEWLAYRVYKDGLYLASKTGEVIRKLVDVDNFGTPTWSPDGRWLVYSRPAEGTDVLFKVNVEIGEEIELYRGGFNPAWRWRTQD